MLDKKVTVFWDCGQKNYKWFNNLWNLKNSLLPTECQIIKVPLYTECYLLPTECQIIKVPLYTECYLLPTECQIIKVPLYTECYLLPTQSVRLSKHSTVDTMYIYVHMYVVCK